MDAPQALGAELDESSAFQANARTILALILGVAIGAVANAAGVGGGAIYIPIFNALVGFELKPSTALSQACITAGALASMAANLPRRHPHDRRAPLIDFPLILMLTPVLLVGVGLGVLLNVMLPTWLLTVLLLLLLILLVTQAVIKGRTLWRQETKRKEALEAELAARDTGERSNRSNHRDDGEEGNEEGEKGGGGGGGGGAQRYQWVRPPSLDGSGSGGGLRPRRRLPHGGGLRAEQDDSLASLEGGGAAAVSAGPSAAASAAGAIHRAASVGQASWDCMEGLPPPAAPAPGDGGDGGPMGGSPDGSSPVGNGGDAAGGGFGAFDPRVGATPRHRAPLSRRSSSSSGWIAFNELGTVDYEDDELASEEMYGTAGEEHGMAGGPPGRAAAVRRALASASGSQLGAMLLLPPLNPPAAGRRGWRRGSGEDGRSVPGLERWGSMGPSRLGAVPEGEEEADSWLQRRSKWRRHFPRNALPHGAAGALGPGAGAGRIGSLPPRPPAASQPSTLASAARAPSIGESFMRAASAAVAAVIGGQPAAASSGDGGGSGGDLEQPLLTDDNSSSSGYAGSGNGNVSGLPRPTAVTGQHPLLRGDSGVFHPRPSPDPATESAYDGGTTWGSTQGQRDASYGSKTHPRTPTPLETLQEEPGGESRGVSGGGAAVPSDEQPYSTEGTWATAATPFSAGNAPAGGPPTRGSQNPMDDLGEPLGSSDEADGLHVGALSNKEPADAVAAGRSDAGLRGCVGRIPLRFAGGVLMAWLLYLVLQILRTESKKCSPGWWALFVVQIVSMLALSSAAVVLAGRRRRRETWTLRPAADRSRSANGPEGNGLVRDGCATDVEGGPTENGTEAAAATVQAMGSSGGDGGSAGGAVLVLAAPLTTLGMTFVAGLTGGLLGLGGGMVMGPLLLHLGVQPQVTAATSGAMVLFSSSCALLQFALLGKLNAQYALIFGGASVVASLVGTFAVSGAVRRSGRPSVVVLALAGVMAIGCLSVAGFGMMRAVQDIKAGEIGVTGLCAES